MPRIAGIAVGLAALAVAGLTGCNSKAAAKPPQPAVAHSVPAGPASSGVPVSTEAADTGGTQVATGTYKCTSYTFSQYGGGNLAAAGYNLIVESGNSYRSSVGNDDPGHMQFSDETHFTFVGGFLDGESGDYAPGASGHIDYHPADKSGRFGCYP